MQLSARLKLFSISPTLALTAKAAAMRAEGIDVISFAAGEPDFNTPEHIQEAAIHAMRDGQTKYTAVGGTPQLKQAIVKKLARDNQLTYQPTEIAVSCGGKHSLYNIFFATLNDGDEVIIPAPYWVSYVDQVKLAGGTPIVVPCSMEDNFLLSPEKLQKAITKRTRMLILNSPANPTGACYPKEDLWEIAKILEKHPQVLIVSDDIYEKILYDNAEFFNLLMLDDQFRHRFLLVNGVSKCYSMTGWRIGYVAADPSVIKAIEALQSQATSNPNSIAQAAAVEALLGDQNCVSQMVQEFAKRRKIIDENLQQVAEIRYKKPQGAFYVFPNISLIYDFPKFKKLASNSQTKSKSKVFCEHLLDSKAVAAVPGIAFGDDDCFRISFALASNKLQEGLRRIIEVVDHLR